MDLRNKPVDEVELSVRTYRCLKNAQIATLGELPARTESELLTSKHFGRKSLNEIKQVLSDFGLHLGMRDDDDDAGIEKEKDDAPDVRNPNHWQLFHVVAKKN